MGLKVLVLGGAGDVGSRAAEELAKAPDVTRITVADRDAERTGALAERLGPRAVAWPVDATDHEALVAAIKGHDVVASALGPFFRFEVPAATAALAAGAHYTSVCDEFDATEALFVACDALARKRGKLVLSGLGTSPGYTNVGVRWLANQLDSVARVDVNVYQPLDAGGGEAVIRHMLHIMTGKVAGFRDGQRVELPACGESRVVDFPRFGPIRVWNMGHAEPVTVPRYLKGVREVNFFMGYGRGSRLLVEPAKRGLFGSRVITDLAVRALEGVGRLTKKGPPADGAVRLDVWGTLDGRDAHRMVCGVGEMREVTGVSLAVGALMVGRGEITTPGGGVYAPEGCLAPNPFIEAMSERGVVAYSDLEMVTKVDSTTRFQAPPVAANA